jgi:UDP-N-acetylmuramyl tripeptide synthase
LSYTWAYYGHIGHYACSSCAWRRPLPTWNLTDLRSTNDGHSEITLDGPEGQLQFTLPLPGAYNAANALAAAAIGSALGASVDVIAPALSGVSAVFGRQEIMPVGAGSLTLTLVKNPTGFNQVLHTMAAGPRFALIVVAINDLFADGTDVSWLWDVDFELLAEQSSRIVCSGLRADDLAVRLKYALVGSDRVEVDADLGRALARAVETARPGETVAVLPTYSAMLLLRRELVRLGLAPPFWEA